MKLREIIQYEKGPDDKTKIILFREVVPIDWDLIYIDYCLQFELIQQLVEKQFVEKQLKGEE